MKLAVEVTYKKTPVLTRSIAFEKSFGFVEQHELVIYNNEQNKIAVAVSRGSLAQEYSLNYGPDWEISFRKE
jgi:S-adenosylmethionine hydrolase